MKIGKRILSIVLASITLLLVSPLTGIQQTDVACASSLKASAIESYGVGDSLYFGSYPQIMVTDEAIVEQLKKAVFTNGKTNLNHIDYYTRDNKYFLPASIEWIVLKDLGDSYLLLSNKILDSRAFGDMFWHESQLRTWLNNDFFTTAFSETDQHDVLTTVNQTFYRSYDDAYINHKPGTMVQTEDKVFLLDLDDVTNPDYGFSTDKGPSASRIAYYTQYINKDETAGTWYIRGPAQWNYGNGQDKYINKDGSQTAWYYTWAYGIRPAIRIAKNAAGISNEPSTVTPILEPDWDEVDSGFTLGRDNNSFWHGETSDSRSGFYNISNHTMSASFYLNLQLHADDFYSAIGLPLIVSANAGGWCYGIVATMGLLYEGYITLSDLTNQKVSDYYSIGKPCNDRRFLDNLNYYFELQSVATDFKNCTKANARTVREEVHHNLKNPQFDSSTYQHFFKELIAFLSTGHVAMLGYDRHAVLATGVKYDRVKKQYEIKIFDENTVLFKDDKSTDRREDLGFYTTIEVPLDYSSFTFHSFANYDEIVNITENDYTQFTFFDMSKFQPYTVHSITTVVMPDLPAQAREYTTISFKDLNKSLLVSAGGLFELKYDNGIFSGNMPVYNINFLSDDLNSDQHTISIDIPNSDSYVITTEDGKTDFWLCNKDGLYVLDADNIDRVVVNMQTGMDIYGKKYSFNAALSTDEKVVETQNGLVSVSGDAKGHIHIGKETDGLKLTADETVEKIKGMTYIGLTSESYNYGNTDSLIIKAEKETSHQLDEFIIVEQATCKKDGLKKGICSKCLKEAEETIPATGEHVDNNNDGKCDTCGQKMTGGLHCKYCGKIHNGAFGWLIKFFHIILAIFKR